MLSKGQRLNDFMESLKTNLLNYNHTQNDHDRLQIITVLLDHLQKDQTAFQMILTVFSKTRPPSK